MNIDSKYPCGLCDHKAWQHYDSIAGGKSFCIVCWDMNIRGGGITAPTEPAHTFVGNNLKYLEKRYMEK